MCLLLIQLFNSDRFPGADPIFIFLLFPKMSVVIIVIIIIAAAVVDSNKQNLSSLSIRD